MHRTFLYPWYDPYNFLEDDTIELVVECSSCDGSGTITLFTSIVDCKECEGFGELLVENTS